MKPPDTPGLIPVQMRWFPTWFSTTAAFPPGCSVSSTVISVSVVLRAIQLNWTPSHSAVRALIVRFPPIVLPLIDQGISPPPPVSATFPPTVNCLSRTVFASVVLTGAQDEDDGVVDGGDVFVACQGPA